MRPNSSSPTRTYRLPIAILLIASAACPGWAANGRWSEITAKETSIQGTQVYEYLSAAKTAFRLTYQGVGSSLKPVFVVYGNTGYANKDAAYSYVTELGLIDLAEQAAADVYLISAVDGKHWDAKADYDLFDTMQYLIPTRDGTVMANTKLVGIGDGATFVNNVLSAHLQRVAGVLTWGGAMDKGVGGAVPVPAYVAGGGSKAVISFFKTANGIKDDVKPVTVTSGVLSYVSKASDLRRVMVDTRSKSPKAAIQAGFTNLLQHNCRLRIYSNWWLPESSKRTRENSDAEAVLMPLMALDGSSPLEYHKITDGVVAGQTNQEWLEFVPQTVLRDPRKTVPLVVYFHGSGNDPAQLFTSGFLEVAEKDNVLVVSPEYALHELDVKKFVDLISDKYPVDRSRIYATGMSAGGMETNAVSVLMPEKLAAAATYAGPRIGGRGPALNAAVAAPTAGGRGQNAAGRGGDPTRLTRLFNEPRYPDDVAAIVADHNKKGIVLPYSFSCGALDACFPVYSQAPDGQERTMLPLLKTIGQFDRIPKLINLRKEEVDKIKSHNDVMGIALENQKLIQLTDFTMIAGTFADGNGHDLVLMTSAHDMAHWQHYQVTAYIWAWMKQFTRDPKTGDLYSNGVLVSKATLAAP